MCWVSSIFSDRRGPFPASAYVDVCGGGGGNLLPTILCVDFTTLSRGFFSATEQLPHSDAGAQDSPLRICRINSGLSSNVQHASAS